MKKTCAVILAISMATLWAGGCQEEQQVSSGDKMARLMALENRGLNRQLQQEAKKHNEEIKNLNTQMQTETKKRDEEIKNLNSQMQKRDEEIKNLNSQLQKQDEEIKNLNSQLQKRDEEMKSIGKRIQTEKENLNADVDNFSKQLAECVQEKQAVMDKAERDIKKQSDELTEGVVVPLLDDMEKLKTEIAQLKEKLSDCERKK
jgi:predicted  nucleic acid-binding Zn-ribbon protein